MLVPTLIFFVLAFGSGFKNRQLWCLLCLIGLAVFIGFRDLDVGTDSHSYYDMFIWAGKEGYHGYPEILYGYSEVLFYRLGFSFWEFQFTLFLISFFLIWRTIRNWSPNEAFSIFVYYGLYLVMYATNATRQIFAVSIVLYAYNFLAQDKKLKFIALIILASGFHVSSLIALAALFISKVKIKSFKFISSTILISLILGFIMPVNALMMLSGDYSHYLNDVDGSGLRTAHRLYLALILSIFWSILLLICTFFIRRETKDNFWVKMYYIAILVNNICMRAEQGLRIVWLFSIAEIIAFPIIVKRCTLKDKWVMQVIISVFLAVFFFTLFITNSADVWPYKNILFE